VRGRTAGPACGLRARWVEQPLQGLLFARTTPRIPPAGAALAPAPVKGTRGRHTLASLTVTIAIDHAVAAVPESEAVWPSSPARRSDRRSAVGQGQSWGQQRVVGGGAPFGALQNARGDRMESQLGPGALSQQGNAQHRALLDGSSPGPRCIAEQAHPPACQGRWLARQAGD